VVFGISLWEKKPDPPPQRRDEEALGKAVHALVEARMNMLRAMLKARAAFLRAQAVATDSQLARDEIDARAAEDDYILAQIDGGP
jgi:hypothetical protein